MRKLTFLLTCLFLVGLGLVNAQSKSVFGKVFSADDGQPVIGATVKVKGTSQGTVTNTDGEFRIILQGGAKDLVISYVGMKTVEVEAKTNIVVKLESDSKQIDEVIVVAYGNAKKTSFTGSASTLSSKSIEKRAISTISSALEGNTSGVQVTSALGQPGSDASIRIRGFGSVNASNDPLYVVDGAVYNGRLSDLNTSDIESVTVLKDAASTSLYGSSAGNGVLLITTKKATSAAEVTLNVSHGWSTRAYKDYSTVGASDYYPLQWQMLKNSYISAGKDATTAAALASGIKSTTGSDGIYDKLKYNPYSGVANDAIVGTDGMLNSSATSLKWGDDLDWVSQAYRTGQRQEYSLGYSTRTDKSDTYASVGYLNDKGYMIKTDFERYTGRVNYNIYPVKWFKSGVNIGLGRNISNYSTATSDNSSAYSNLTRFVRNMAPIYPIHKHDLTTGAYLNSSGVATTNPSEYVYDYDGTRMSDPGRDAVVETLWNSRKSVRGNTNGRSYITITPVKDLEVTANYALDMSDLRQSEYENPYVGDGTAGPARLGMTSSRSTTQTFNQLISYNKKWNKHSFDALLGHENYKYGYEYFYSMKTDEIVSGVTEFGNFVSISDVTSYTNTYTKEGYFGRLNYGYNNRYYGTFSYRHDGSSRFSKENRWGDFASLGASWRISEESFIKDVKWIDNLKLRASYGETGNDAILDADLYNNYYPYQPLYDLGLNNGSEAGAYFSTLANKDLKWETQVSKDLAIEFGFLKKVTGTIELFRKESKDLLFDVAMATSTGVASLTQNIGKVQNQGAEIELNVEVFKNKDWSVFVGGNATFLQNKILRLPDANRENGIVSGSKKLMEGHSMYDFWLKQWYGVDSNTGNGLYYLDTDAYNADKGTLTSTVQSTIVTGANGEKLTNSYLYAKYDYSGSALPDVYGGFNASVSYKGFDLGALFSYSLGSKVLDLNYASLMSVSSYGAGMSTDLERAWQKVGDVTDVPRLDNNSTHATSIGTSYSTRWLVSGDYLNFKSLTLGYTVPAKLLKSLQLKTTRLSLTAENLFLLSARQGLNPQGQYNGITYNEYLPSRTYSISLKVTF